MYKDKASKKAYDAKRYRTKYDTDPEFRAQRLALIKERASYGRALISAVKLSKGCADCGYNEWPEALQFDHLRDKITKVAGMSVYSEEAILAEIEKCEVVCANCHARRTVDRNLKRGRTYQ